MRLLVTGQHGQVASALVAKGQLGGVEVMTLGRPAFDLADPAGFSSILADMRPDVVVNAAAHTAVDQAEAEPDLAHAINGVAPGVIARACAGQDVPLIHISTDYVFDGSKPTPYVETDIPAPLGVYGASKHAGELAVAAGNARHVILRTAWVYSAEGRNFVRTMVQLAQSRPVLNVVSDQFGCPTFAEDMAAGILNVAEQIRAKPASDACFGTFHMAGSGDTSWAGLAEAIFAQSKAAGRPFARVMPISTAQYPTPARRPANSRLCCAKLENTFGIHLPHWSDALERCLTTLFKAA